MAGTSPAMTLKARRHGRSSDLIRDQARPIAVRLQTPRDPSEWTIGFCNTIAVMAGLVPAIPIGEATRRALGEPNETTLRLHSRKSSRGSDLCRRHKPSCSPNLGT
ncbi:hypothetical protein CHELA20_52797 [Hyphomicrobiales bacterium]|nr:hypothetical protein CHELA41_22128 [Hyphomicrobiales bacterium]CAH1682949.1 hypothetical protein CHELA20_52797 [Hyphomicrobiales bacterium]